MTNRQDPSHEDDLPDDADEASPDCFVFGADDDPTFDARTSLQVEGRFASPRQASSYAAQVQAHFIKAPEGAVCGGFPSPRLADLLDFAHEDFGVPVAHLTPAQVEELVFVIAPRHLALGPSAAPMLLGEARALFAFLGRTYGAPHAAGWTEVLRAERGDELVRRFADPAGFSPDKAAYMRALRQAGERRSRPASNPTRRAATRAQKAARRTRRRRAR